MQFMRSMIRAATEINFVLTVAVIILVGALALNRAQAQQPATAPQELGSVVVTASRSDTKIEDMALHTTVITREDIRKSPAQTLDQVLRNVPGMNFTGIPAVQTDPTGHQTKMRGLGNAKVLVLLDGVPIMDPFYLTTQFFKIPLSNIERIEVVRGGNSSLWGNMAVAGVINVVSKRVKDNAGEAGVSVGTRGTASGSVVKNVAVSDALGFNLAVDELHWNGYQVTPNEYLWRFPQKAAVDARDSNVQLTAFFNPNADLKGYLRMGYHIQDQDISYQYGNNLQQNPDMSAGLTWTPDGRSSVQANAWAQYVRFEKYNGSTCYFNPAAPAASRCPSSTAVTTAQINNNSILQYFTQYGSQRYREQGASAIYSRSMSGAWSGLQLGADYRRLTATDLEYFYGAPTAFAAPQGNLNSSTYGEAKQVFTGVFAQGKVSPFDPLEVTLSARYDAWDNTDRLNTRRTAAGVTTGGPFPDSTKTALDPSIALRYNLSDALALRGAAYKSFRAPGFNNTTRTFGSTTPTIANPNLGPENLKGLEFGGDYNAGPLSVSATVFQYNIDNMIATFRVNSYATAPDVVRTICSSGGANLNNCGGSANYYTNDQNGRSRGLELVGNWRASDTLTLNAMYTYTSTELTWRGAVVTDPLNVQLAGVPWSVASVGATWKAMDRLSAYAELRYIGRMYIDTTSVANAYFQQGSAAVFNATATYALDRSTDVRLSIINLFDKAYSENAYTYNQPYNRTLSMPRTINVGLNARF
ncbi:MAG TPA: TonB-dependent receptor [Burkholderiales bacterium]|nr:TonB-dependent receptor [Burkholderiales bacterium]